MIVITPPPPPVSIFFIVYVKICFYFDYFQGKKHQQIDGKRNEFNSFSLILIETESQIRVY